MALQRIAISKSKGQQALSLAAINARSWITDKALPYWAAHGIDNAGGFCEELTQKMKPNWQAIRRLRVQARQIYTYAAAYENGWYEGLPTVDNAMNFMLKNGYMPDGNPGFISLLNADYSVNDPRRDLYDHAFYLLALAWHSRVTGSHTTLALADNIIHFMQENLTASSEGKNTGYNNGFWEGIPKDDSRNALRRQNPHMHLLEAFMALYDASGDKKYLRRAANIFSLFKRYFFDPDTQTITEFFHHDWQPARGAKGQSVEPGHMAEWVWLLAQYQMRSGVDTRPWADKLYAKLCQYQTELKPTNFLPDEMDKSGNVLRSTRRLWVQTELVKAHLAQAELDTIDSYQLAATTLSAVAEKYLRPDGVWIDSIGENGLPVLGAIPTSSFYHIIGMITESCRVAGLTDTRRTKDQLRV